MSQKLEAILAARGIEYRQGGRFEILVRCPLCGASDPSQHLAVSTRNRGWRCLRNPRQHRGTSYVRLLILILRCTEEAAREMLGVTGAVSLPDQDDFSQQWRKQLGVEVSSSALTSLQFPKEFKRLVEGGPQSGGFWKYLKDRGFSFEQRRWLAEMYQLHYTISGRYSYRIIIPITDERGKLMTWTARSIDPDADIRYMTLSKEYALAPPGDLLLGLQMLWRTDNARCLVICEGPFDAMAISALGHEAGVWGTDIFGLELSAVQADLLAELAIKFDRMVVLLDPNEAWLRLLDMRSRLPRNCKSQHLPAQLKDPGELVGYRDGEAFVRSLAA
jgi:DNA primase catalytic core, N-terminal domain